MLVIVFWFWKLEVELVELLRVLLNEVNFLFEADIAGGGLFPAIFIIVQHEILCRKLSIKFGFQFRLLTILCFIGRIKKQIQMR